MPDTELNNIMVVIPALNPSSSLVELVRDLRRRGFSKLLVVNDGSTSECEGVFLAAKEVTGVEVLRHEVNKGKGAALKTGIRAALIHADDIAGILTVDADGQHLPGDVEKVARYAMNNRHDVIIGTRDFSRNVPFRSRFGNVLTVVLLSILYGISVDDSQTGLRYLPREILPHLLTMPGERYEFELECLFAARNLGFAIIQVPIQTVYIDQNVSSHFRPIIDSYRIYKIFFRFSASSLLCFGLDVFLFSLFIVVSGSVIYSTLMARAISGLVNFTINKTFVFNRGQSNRLFQEAAGYFALWLAVALASGFIVSTIESAPAYAIIPFKVMVDVGLFFVSFYVQREYVFSGQSPD